MMRLPSLAIRAAARHRMSFSRALASVQQVDDTGCTTALDNLHKIIEDYRKSNFPESMPHEFMEQVLDAADENMDGRLSIDEMMVMLRNLYSNQPLTPDEVFFIMERDLGMKPGSDSVPLAKVKQLLLELNH